MKLDQKEILKNHIKKGQKVLWIGGYLTNYLVENSEFDIDDFYFVDPIMDGPGKIYHYAVSYKYGKQEFYYCDQPARNSLFQGHAVGQNLKPTQDYIMTELITMDGLFNELKLDHIDWVIMNAEGAEYLIFQTKTHDWIEKTNNMIITFHTNKPGGMPENRETIREGIYEILKRDGFSITEQIKKKKFVRAVCRRNV